MNALRIAVIPLALVLGLSGCATNSANGGSPQSAANDLPTASPTPTKTPSPESTVEPDATAPKATITVKCNSSVMKKTFTKAGLDLQLAMNVTQNATPGGLRDISTKHKGMSCAWDSGQGTFSTWWTTVDSATWNATEKAIVAVGSAITAIPEINADVAYFLVDDHWQGTGHAHWTLDALHGSTWIHMTSTDWNTPADGAAAYAAALKIAKLRD
jgi:hypothetical protein